MCSLVASCTLVFQPLATWGLGMGGGALKPLLYITTHVTIAFSFLTCGVSWQKPRRRLCRTVGMAWVTDGTGVPSLNEKHAQAASLPGWTGYVCQPTYKIGMLECML